MNVRAQVKQDHKHLDFLKKLSFQPVFDENGSIAGIREMEISTDRRDGVKAMQKLYETSQPGDDVLGADGWTVKQKRILSTPAPLEAHYMRYAEKWDARTGLMRDGALITLPFEVVWALFENLFEGQYSFKVNNIFNEDEEVVPVGVNHTGDSADDAPGRRFFARASVTLCLHLPGQAEPRVYDGVGVSYGQLRTEKTGNIYAINSERRTVDKGAVADAKREALANMGRVFRRAFEDGDEMQKHTEDLLLAHIQEMNRPAIHKRDNSEKSVPAPVRKNSAEAKKSDKSPKEEKKEIIKNVDSSKQKTEGPAQKADKKETVAASKADPKKEEKNPDTVQITLPDGEVREIPRKGFAEVFLDTLFETCVTGSEAETLVSNNESVIAEHVEDRAEIDELVKSMAEQPEDEIPDFSVPSQNEAPSEEENVASEEDLRIEVDGKSGKQVLSDLQEALGKMKTVSELNAIIAANPAALRKLTPKQMGRFTEFKSELETKLKK